MPPTNRNRRQTLGVVSNTARRRDSMDANQQPLPPSSTQKGTTRHTRKSRVSMIPRMQGRENLVPPSPGLAAPTQASRRRSVRGGGGGDRRQTLGGPGDNTNNHQHPHSAASPTRHGLPPTGGSVVRTDPRPIHDKAYQQECIKKLLDFLLQGGYEYPITHKSLSRPSGKDFSNIVTFMLRQVDPSFQEPSGAGGAAGGGKDGNGMKFEDEVAMNFKALGYPYTISKTALVAAGSPHTWPTLLAALTWLMELLQIIVAEDVEDELDIRDSQPFETVDELEITTDKVFFTFLQQAYDAFLQGDQKTQDELEYALADRFEQDDKYIEQEIERVTDLNAAMVEKMNGMMEEAKELPKLIKKRDDYASDLEQFRDLIRQMDEHIAALNQKVQARSEELGVTNKKMETMNTSIEGLKKALEKQAVSLGDIYKIQSELKGVEEALDRALSTKEKLRSSTWETAEQLGNLFTELECDISTLNSRLSEIALLPHMDEVVSSFKVALDKSSALEKDRSKLLGLDLGSVVNPMLSQMKEKYLVRANEAKKEYQQALDELEKCKNRLTESLEKLKILEARKHKMEEELENERETQEAKIAVRVREVEAIEASVASINNPVALEEQLAQYDRQCAELEALRLQRQEENLANKKAVECEIETACQSIMELESFFKAKTSEVNQYWLMKMTMNAESVQSATAGKEN